MRYYINTMISAKRKLVHKTSITLKDLTLFKYTPAKKLQFYVFINENKPITFLDFCMTYC